MRRRLIAQAIATGQFLHWDLPVTGLTVTYTLSGPCVISGTIAPEFADVEAAGLVAWGTWIHLEEDGQIRCSCILHPFSGSGQTLTLSAESPSGYPTGIPYLGQYFKVNADPLDVVREIWRHIQSFPASNLGVIVSPDTSPARVGVVPPVVVPPATPLPPGTPPILAAPPAANPYQLDWWNHTDCGQEINTLAASAPFDYADQPAWNADKTAVVQNLRLAYPRLGGKRYDLRFAQDENITDVVPLAEGADQWVTDVVVIGAGSGLASVRGNASAYPGNRIRRVAVVTDQTIITQAVADARANAELYRRQASLVAVSSVTCSATHPNAPYGSFAPGDDILVQATLPWFGPISFWHRITSYTYTPEANTMQLTLARSESFRYGLDGPRDDSWIMDDPALSVLDATAMLG